jgi:hypothetical protein
MNNKLQKAVNDQRYSIALEFTGGSENALHVIRFCDKFIGSSETVNGAILLAIFHQDERNLKLI